MKVARESSAEGRIIVADGVDDLLHVVPFAQMQRYALSCRVHICLAVRNEKFAHIDTVETGCNGNVVGTSDRVFVIDGNNTCSASS